MDDKNTPSGKFIYTTTDKDADPIEIFDQFFGTPKPVNKSQKSKFPRFFKKYGGILVALGMLFSCFIVFYVWSIISWSNGKCLVLVPSYGDTSNITCASITDAFTNALILFVSMLVITAVVIFLKAQTTKS